MNTKKTQEPDRFTDEFYETFKDELAPKHLRLLHETEDEPF